MTTKYYLAVDLGATSGRTVLSTYKDGRLEMTEYTRFSNPLIPHCGHLYWDLMHLYHEILVALRKTDADGIPLTSIGIDTWGCDFAFFDADGQLIGAPYSYRDSHTDGAPERYFADRMPARELYERTGIQFMPFNSLFQLDTLYRNKNRFLVNANKVLFIPDALIYMLTGVAVCEYTVCSTGQIVNPQTKLPDSDLLDSVGLSVHRLGRPIMPGTFVGNLSSEVQQTTGVGPLPVIAVAGHDTASAVVAVPATTLNYAYLSCGTWSLLGIESPHPIITEDSYRHNFTNEGGLDGTTRFLKNICGLWILEQCRKEFKDAPADINELNALALQSEYAGLIYPDDTSFAHPESMMDAIRWFCIRTGQCTPETTADFVRCIFRSLALRYRQVLLLLQQFAPFPIGRLHVIGGGSRNRYLMQMTADAIRMPVVAGPAEGTALGNTLVQLKALGEVDSLTQMRHLANRSIPTTLYTPQPTEAWDEAYNFFEKLNEASKI